MKTALAFLLIAAYCVPAFAEQSNADFCQDYKNDQARISEVKKNGWIKGTLKKEYLYGCLDLKWRDQLYKNLCLNQKQDIILPSSIFFYFDGFGNFIPDTVKRQFEAVNLTGKEPAGSLKAGIYFLESLFPYVQSKIDSREELKGMDSKKIRIRNDVQFHYHSGSGTDKIQGIENASVCYSSMLKDLKLIEKYFPALPQPKKIIMGYSNGGDSAIKFVNHFTSEEDAEFDLVATVDPVPRAGGFIKNKLTFSETVFKLEHPEKISHSMNFYQKTNEAVLAGIIGIKGSKVDGVDFEKEFKDNHSYILMNFHVISAIATNFAAHFYPEITEEMLQAKREADLQIYIENLKKEEAKD